jgi:N-acetylneuraminic acid mutarotase
MVRYKMVARDVNSLPTQYRTWIVDDEPDFTGEFYTGLKSGPEPFIDVTAYEIPDGYIVDFNLPLPNKWKPVFRTMPEVVANSQLAIIDGYAYLFGGEVSAKIFQAPLNNPANWVDTGASLPNVLSGSSLAIIGDRIYLFGGRIDETVENIYSAPVTNPLDWVDHGPLLPDKIHKQQLAIVDGYIYLYGGEKKDFAVEYIFRASVDDPLTWTQMPETLPQKLYGSHLAILGNHIYLLGGLHSLDAPTANIYRAPISNPLSWSIVGTLPWPAAYGQFLRLGHRAYLFTPGNYSGSQPYQTRVLRCNVTDPLVWYDDNTFYPGSFVPGSVAQSQFAIIYDRLFAFGGSGSSVIYASEQQLKYKPDYFKATPYANNTRTQYQASSELDRFKTLGFPWWKTNYAT